MRVTAVELAPGVGAWFTGRAEGTDDPPAVGVAGNLSHRRPHVPGRLARDRADACAQMGVDPGAVHLMHQVHGRGVGVVGDDTPPGAEVAGVDALVTALPGRPLAVQAADCVPVLIAHGGVVAAVHAGRRGVGLGVTDAALDAMARLGAAGGAAAVVGPAIGGCCYAVPTALRDEVAAAQPVAATTTTWGAPSLDLPAAVVAALERRGVAVTRAGGCTRCDAERRWFSHRADPLTGRQLGVVVLTAASHVRVAA